MNLSPEELLQDWYLRLRFAQYSHYEAAKSFDRMNYWLGVPVVIFSTFVGTSVFANIGEKVSNDNLKILLGLVSVLAATLSGIQTFLRFSERAEKHRVAAAKYGALRRQIEEILCSTDAVTRDIIAALRQEIDRLAEETPHIPERIWARRQEVLQKDKISSVGLLSKEHSSVASR